jgi:hypothetical protein
MRKSALAVVRKKNNIMQRQLAFKVNLHLRKHLMVRLLFEIHAH